MGYVNGEIFIRAPAQAAFDFMSDPDHFAEWIEGYEEGKILTPHKTGVGSAFKWYGRLGPIKLGSSELVVEWAPGKKVAYRGSMFGVGFNSSMEIEDRGDSIRMIVAIEYNVPVWEGGDLADRLFLRKLMQSYVDNSLLKLKDKLERP
jgi:uncharacterized membrane protein